MSLQQCLSRHTAQTFSHRATHITLTAILIPIMPPSTISYLKLIVFTICQTVRLNTKLKSAEWFGGPICSHLTTSICGQQPTKLNKHNEESSTTFTTWMTEVKQTHPDPEKTDTLRFS